MAWILVCSRSLGFNETISGPDEHEGPHPRTPLIVPLVARLPGAVGVPEDHHGGDDSDSTSDEKADCRAIHGSAWLAGRSSSHLEPLLVRSVTARLASGIATRIECYHQRMPCSSGPCSKVHDVVKRWMDSHRELGGFWDVFDVRMGLDVVISIHRADGVRQLSLAGQQAASTLTQEVETRILDWLDNLSSQPTVQDRKP